MCMCACVCACVCTRVRVCVLLLCLTYHCSVSLPQPPVWLEWPWSGRDLPGGCGSGTGDHCNSPPLSPCEDKKTLVHIVCTGQNYTVYVRTS